MRLDRFNDRDRVAALEYLSDHSEEFQNAEHALMEAEQRDDFAEATRLMAAVDELALAFMDRPDSVEVVRAWWDACEAATRQQRRAWHEEHGIAEGEEFSEKWQAEQRAAWATRAEVAEPGQLALF